MAGVRLSHPAPHRSAPRLSTLDRALPASIINENTEMVTKRYHWIFDAEGISTERVTDEDLLRRMLHGVAEICEMKIVGGPMVIEGVPENPGLTAFCIVDFSHISIHTFSVHNEICIDVFSCKPFAPEKIRRYLTDIFQADAARVTFFEVQYPE